MGYLSKNAMIIVSMENKDFDTDFLVRMLHMCAEFHDYLYIIIADDLFLYNRPIFSEAPNRASIFSAERSKYVRNAVSQAHSAKLKVIQRRWRSFCTPRFMEILRRLYMLIVSETTLLDIVDNRAHKKIERKLGGDKYYPARIRYALSRAYIMEETAMSLHLASNYDIADEYYPDDQAPVLGAIYDWIDRYDLYSRLALRRHEKRFWNLEKAPRSFHRTIEWANLRGSNFG